MQRNESERRAQPRRKLELEGQSRAGQPHPESDGNDTVQDSSYVPSFITAQELQIPDPAKRVERRQVAGDRRRVLMRGSEEE